MGFQCGIVGLPNVGKSTIFNALTSAKAEAANYPFCTIDPNTGIVKVPDPRMTQIQKYIPTDKIVPAAMIFVDIAGLVKGASKGEGLGNQFLGHIRETQAIAHVVRCFDDPNVVHVDGSVNPIRDVSVIDTELIFADLDTISKRYSTIEKTARSGDKKCAAIMSVLGPIKAALESGKPVRSLGYDEDQLALVQDFHLITAKKVMYVANTDEHDIGKKEPNQYVKQLIEYAKSEGSPVVQICGKIEAEVCEMPQDEKETFLKEMGMEEPGLNRVIRAGYDLLGLQTYFTAGQIEVRAWTIKKGWKAPQAAGVIHTDFEKGFIRAEVFHFDDLMKYKSETAIKEAGALRLEGKEYVVKDGDIMHFRFAN
ncbi:MAG TPA: redox-regulated ATPase YchF [Bdellovibrionales bacterium]|nr:MAG: redox-regulated ATPase YchF [Bdellovibrionales bacterium GWB1_52_6]OFZ05831.1 MAG: redox-regulated ATPase YchF [Bdellovibrionales bacterium GWA1_52_35]OFZ39340.1 MAG: redox-regulated ATPase YchF [Bdellovibrionales bacterium GWC1_52_8]HAR43581.1 redox-regulated ATPase YchF [Bdellovibrionales bacterium]HCM40224.1 redox-regulated ATPase YchF [Bdellovibrionales bacterium]